MDEFAIGVLSNVGMLSFLALSAYLLLVTGEISFGQQAFFALGAYGAGIGTAVWGWPLPAALAWGAALGSAAAALVGALTLRLRGMYFAVATLAFAEAVRIALELFRYQAQVGGEPVGPDGTEGFRGIRYVLEHDIGPGQYLAMIWALLAVAVALLLWAERSRAGRVLRMVGEDEALAAMQGVDVVRVKLAAASAAGLLAGLGGGLYAHLMTYVEPRNFDIMLGVHSLAYGLIGGLGSALGPLLGVAIDIGLLESTRWFSGYRMIVFGGLVAVLLIVRPRGLLDERLVHRIRLARRRKLHAVH
jgi:branched-chain amino acid transport system permease protein